MLPGGRPDPAHRTVQRVGVEQESADVAVPGVPVEREDAVAGGDDVRERLVPHLPDDELPGGKGQRKITGGLRRGFRLAPAGYEQEALAAGSSAESGCWRLSPTSIRFSSETPSER